MIRYAGFCATLPPAFADPSPDTRAFAMSLLSLVVFNTFCRATTKHILNPQRRGLCGSLLSNLFEMKSLIAAYLATVGACINHIYVLRKPTRLLFHASWILRVQGAGTVREITAPRTGPDES
eukprot:scaffold3813_cov146-Amphora_coffeaeformis.AAC.1